MSGSLKTVQLQVPESAEEGDILAFLVEGKELEIPIPQGNKPGDILEIQIRVENPDEDGDGDGDLSGTKIDSEITKVELHESIGVTLRISSSVPGVEEEEDDDDKETDTKDGSDGTSSMAWPAGLHLAKFISSPSFDEFISLKTVVELGSGTGLCGIAFAASASNKLSKRKKDAKALNIILTDVPKSKNLLEYNIRENEEKLRSSFNLCAKPLTWGEEKDASDLNLSDIDLILCSDLLYNVSMETFKALSSTIQSLDPKKNAKIIISVRWRKPEEERKFFYEMEKLGYVFKLLNADDDDSNDPYLCKLGWKEFGDPKNNASNNFFSSSFTQVDGETKSLKDVSEDDMDVMSDKEFNAFEKRFIQIYVGTCRAE